MSDKTKMGLSPKSKKRKITSPHLYSCEGLIKEVSIESEEVHFKLEPSMPYIFEKKSNNGSTERYLLFVDDANSRVAPIFKADQTFLAPPLVDFHSLIIAKANRMKVCLKVDDTQISGDTPMKVNSIFIV